MKKALLILNAQYEYSRAGNFPLWNFDSTLHAIQQKIIEYDQLNLPIIFVQQVAPKGSVLFEEHSREAQLMQELINCAKQPYIVSKHFPDAFEQTQLAQLLIEQQISHIALCGMMTQNCVLFTALSEQAKAFQVQVLANYCTSVSRAVHEQALQGLARIAQVA